jgi:hypothetical protein
MSENAFAKATTDLLFAIDEAFKRQAPLPAFILFYSSIDIFSSLTRPVGSDDTSGIIFQDWVKKYMLPGSSLTCNEEDIWGARCGLLHTYTVQARLSRQGKVRELHYIGDRGLAEFAQQKIDPNFQDKVFVYLPDLISAFLTAIERFAQDVQSNSSLRATVFAHSAKLIIHDRKEIN